MLRTLDRRSCPCANQFSRAPAQRASAPGFTASRAAASRSQCHTGRSRRSSAAGGDVALREIARYMISSLAVCGLAANGRDCDMPHRRVGLGAMPMAFTGLDVHDITYLDLMLLVLGRHHAGARGHDQDLIA